MPDLVDLFPGFASHWIDTQAGKIFARSKGDGPSLLLLHGFPQSHVMWHRLAPALAEKFSVVAMDMRGYGWSGAPRSEGGALYAKRVMGTDVITVMEDLGHVRFRLAGHDRGGRVAYRLALDHPGHVEKLALLDILPTTQVWANIRSRHTPAAHWSFLSQPAPQPETEIGRNPDAYFEGLLGKWSNPGGYEVFDPNAMAWYRAAWNDPLHIHAMCEDYRAGATIDLKADEDDLAAGRKILCPVLALNGDFYLTRGASEAPLDVWRRTFAPQATGGLIKSGHFLAEENPHATLEALLGFF